MTKGKLPPEGRSGNPELDAEIAEHETKLAELQAMRDVLGHTPAWDSQIASHIESLARLRAIRTPLVPNPLLELGRALARKKRKKQPPEWRRELGAIFLADPSVTIAQVMARFYDSQNYDINGNGDLILPDERVIKRRTVEVALSRLRQAQRRSGT